MRKTITILGLLLGLFFILILLFGESCKEKASDVLGIFFYEASSEKPILDSLASIPDPIELEQKSKDSLEIGE